MKLLKQLRTIAMWTVIILACIVPYVVVSSLIWMIVTKLSHNTASFHTAMIWFKESLAVLIVVWGVGIAWLKLTQD